MARVTTGLYSFDPNGNNPANVVTNERQTLQVPGLEDYYFIIPFAAPFFVDSMVIANDATGVPYVEGVDYVFGHRFVEAMESTGRIIAGSIRFMRRDITGIVRMTYRTIGGQWGFDDAAILAELANRQFNPLVRTWGMIDVLPATFPPLPHDQQIDDLIGSDELLGGLEDIAAAIEAAGEGSTSSHISDTGNPHQVTKAQVGLGSVQNYPIASEPEARAGTATDRYMTPQRTAQAIDELALNPLEAHVANTNNPHGVDKSDVGLSNVQNYPVANETEAVDPAINNRYMTPYTVALLLQDVGSGAQIEALEEAFNTHAADTDNPHGVTADQVGAYTRSEVDQLLAGFQAEDTTRFNGMTEEEWRETLPSIDDVTELVTKIQTEYGQANATVGGIDVTLTSPAAFPIAVELAGGFDRYIACLDNGRAVEVPVDGLLGDDLSGRTESFCVLEDAAYYITPAGHIRAVGSAAIQPPAAYLESSGTPPANPAKKISASADKVYVVLNDDSVMEYDGTTTNITEIDVSEVVVWPAATGEPARAVFIYNDDTAAAFGDFDFASKVNAVIGSLTGVFEVAILDDELYVRRDTGNLNCWSIEFDGTNYTLASVVLPIIMANDVESISASRLHIAVLKTDGTVHTRGDNTTYALDVNATFGPFVAVAAGVGFTVTVTDTGEINYWGAATDNRFVPPVNFKGVE